jgi:hypothetical protein
VLAQCTALAHLDLKDSQIGAGGTTERCLFCRRKSVVTRRIRRGTSESQCGCGFHSHKLHSSSIDRSIRLRC